MIHGFYPEPAEDGVCYLICDESLKLLYAASSAHRSPVLASRLASDSFTLPSALVCAARKLLDSSGLADTGETLCAEVRFRMAGRRLHALCEARSFGSVRLAVFAISGALRSNDLPAHDAHGLESAAELGSLPQSAEPNGGTDTVSVRRCLSACFAPRYEEKRLYRCAGLIDYWLSTVSGATPRSIEHSRNLPDDGYAQLCGEAFVTVTTVLMSVLLEYTHGTVYVDVTARRGGFYVSLEALSGDSAVLLRAASDPGELCRAFARRLPQILCAACVSRSAGFTLEAFCGGTDTNTLRFELGVDTFDIGALGFKACDTYDNVRASLAAALAVFW